MCPRLKLPGPSKTVYGRVWSVQDCIWKSVVCPRLYLAECCLFMTLSGRMWSVQEYIWQSVVCPRLYRAECGLFNTLSGKVWSVQDLIWQSLVCPRLYLAKCGLSKHDSCHRRWLAPPRPHPRCQSPLLPAPAIMLMSSRVMFRIMK